MSNEAGQGTQERVKIFVDTGTGTPSFRHLENAVDMWMGDNPDIQIVDRQLHTALDTMAKGAIVLTIVIFYRPPYPKTQVIEL